VLICQSWNGLTVQHTPVPLPPPASVGRGPLSLGKSCLPAPCLIHHSRVWSSFPSSSQCRVASVRRATGSVLVEVQASAGVLPAAKVRLILFRVQVISNLNPDAHKALQEARQFNVVVPDLRTRSTSKYQSVHRSPRPLPITANVSSDLT
jgi:hypothetical protein